MRQGYAHQAVLGMTPDADDRAPGAAVTVALCGDWEHAPPCPVAPHHTRAERVGGEVRLRILFATEPHRERSVRRDIDGALARGELTGPDGATTRWRLLDSRPAEPSAQEAEHLQRLLRG
ncbi:hypothetical protein [Micromonospora sp. NPDC003776]